MLPQKFRRSVSICIPLLSALLLLGIISGILKIDANTNIANTGLTLGIILGILNFYLVYMVFKHQVP